MQPFHFILDGKIQFVAFQDGQGAWWTLDGFQLKKLPGSPDKAARIFPIAMDFKIIDQWERGVQAAPEATAEEKKARAEYFVEHLISGLISDNPKLVALSLKMLEKYGK